MRGMQFILAVAAMLALGGCELIGDIFKAGMWVGVIIVVAIIAGILFVVSRIRR